MKNKGLLLVAVLFTIAAIGCYGFLFMEIKGKNERISELVNRIDSEASEENVLRSIKTMVAETAPMREELLKFTVGKDDAVSFIELLETVGRDAGVSVDIDSVTPAEIAGGGGVEALKLSLKITGAWAKVLTFLGLLEFLPYETKVEQVSVSRSELPESPWGIHANLIVLKEK